MGYKGYGQWGTGVWGLWAMGHRVYGPHRQWVTWAMGYRVWGIWAMRPTGGYRGMGYMGNRAHGVWGTKGMGHVGNGIYGQWGTGV